MKDNILNNLKVKGYSVIENYYSPELCDLITYKLHTIFPTGFQQTPSQTQSNLQTGGDYRMGESQRYIPECNDFLEDSFINEIANSYIGHNYTKKRCMANVVVHNPEVTTSSGGGWHVDNHSPQFKSFMFLTDVNDKNGPLSIIENSRGLIDSLDPYNEGYRLTEEKVLSTFESTRIKTLCVKKGTLVLADTSNIHRGNNIQEGTRYALTNYFYH